MGYNRSVESKRRNKLLYEKTKNGYGPGCWFDDKRGCYRKSSLSDYGCTRYLKRLSAKKVRKSKEIGKGYQYRKVYDLLWELF